MTSKMSHNSPDPSRFRHLLEQAHADPRVLAIIVFGSYARGEQNRDVDVCVVLIPGQQEANAWELLPERPADIDLSIFSDLPLYVRSRVVKEGNIILNKDYNLLFDIYRQTIKDFVLFEPHYKTFLEAVKSG
jgi:predicted nucleotidyltransferase